MILCELAGFLWGVITTNPMDDPLGFYFILAGAVVSSLLILLSRIIKTREREEEIYKKTLEQQDALKKSE